VFPYRLLIAEVVILFDQAIEQRLLRAAPHLLNFQRQQFTQGSTYCSCIGYHWFGPPPIRQRVPCGARAHRWQLDLTGAIKP